MMARFKGGKDSKSLKPNKDHKTLKTKTLSEFIKKTLGSGNLKLAVELPPGEDINEWIAANTVDFFNEISLMYGLVVDEAKEMFKEPGSGFPPNFEYRWIVQTAGKRDKAIPVSSPEYVDYVMTWVEDQLDNEEIFPVLEAEDFPENFLEYIGDIYKRLFRIFAIIYHRHFDSFEELEATAHLNTTFKHFMFFCFQFELLEDEETKVLQGPVAKLRTDFDSLPGRGDEDTDN
ncbi:MOB kinase activator 1B (Mob1 homolog 1A) (Mps one binder kinase activator-like 1A) [Durusdinium trenchii]|uniref:MOB kinase activator 1B (Mob1 homolog 1A) (Mps one binder kinase activator-like 1A) n=1 Tax=Durusdinium trenchii TaxID=1381693 RepID=A0ABP0HKV4_9DINO